MSEVQASWQTPSVSAFAHMRAASETRREALLKQPVSKHAVFTRNRLLKYHCVIWSVCTCLTLSVSLANCVIFASPAALLADNSGMRVVVNVTRLAHASGRVSAGSADWRQALYLEAGNSLALYLPFFITILVGLGVVVFSWWRHRRLSNRLLHAQPYYVAPTAGRLPVVILTVCLLVPFGLPTAKRLLDLALMIADDPILREVGTERTGVFRAGTDWGTTANVVWAASLGGQGVGTAAVGLIMSVARRARKTAVQAQPI